MSAHPPPSGDGLGPCPQCEGGFCSGACLEVAPKTLAYYAERELADLAERNALHAEIDRLRMIIRTARDELHGGDEHSAFSILKHSGVS